MTTLPLTNGHAPPRDTFHDRDTHQAEVFEAEIADLRSLLDDELKGRRELERLLDNSKERERRLARAIAVLEHGSTTGAQAERAAAAAKPKPKSKRDGARKSDGSWNVSPETVERVRVAFLRYRDAHPDVESWTMTTLATWLGEQGEGIGGETIRRAVEQLRERELVRKCGTTRGGGALWAPMPEQSD